MWWHPDLQTPKEPLILASSDAFGHHRGPGTHLESWSQFNAQTHTLLKISQEDGFTSGILALAPFCRLVLCVSVKLQIEVFPQDNICADLPSSAPRMGQVTCAPHLHTHTRLASCSGQITGLPWFWDPLSYSLPKTPLSADTPSLSFFFWLHWVLVLNYSMWI